MQEVEYIMQHLGREQTDKERKDMLYEADLDRNGLIDFSEFVSISKKYFCKPSEEDKNEAESLFALYDKDKDGFIAGEELEQLRSMLMELGVKTSEDIVDEMIREADLNGDGKISFYEFKTLMDNN